MLKLVGDNPFNGVSHLSQEQAASRGAKVSNPEYAAQLVKTSLDNGADGFMFSVSEMTLSILRILKGVPLHSNPKLYAITPAAGESARGMGASGGVEGLIKSSAKQILSSRNVKAMSLGIKGSITLNPDLLFRSFVSLEISKIRSAAGKNAVLESIMLHEIVTDIGLALNLKWVFESFINFMQEQKIQAGFETRNFPFLVSKFREWDLDLSDVAIAAPFNKIGFLMIPSKEICEQTLASLPESNVIAISPLAAGYLKPLEAVDYLREQRALKGVAIAVSKEQHAQETFKIFG